MGIFTYKYRVLILAIVMCAASFQPGRVVAAEGKYEKLFYTNGSQSGVESFKKNVKSVDVIAPQSYAVNMNLTVAGSVNSEILNTASANGVKVMPLLVNAGFSQKVMHTLLTAPPDAQDKVINYLIAEANKNKYVGWQFDLEHIYYKDRDLYSMFVERTALAFKKYNLQLSIAAVARTNESETEFYRQWSGAFDYTRLAKAVDFISIMTYDDPNSVGPTASIPFVEGVYKYLEDKVPPDKLSLGVPLYYWGWSVSPPKRVRSGGSYERLQYLRATYNTVEGFSSYYQVPYLVYSLRGSGYIVWHEDAKSFGIKLDLMKKHKLRGFSAWVLGLENPGIWDVLKN